MQQVQEQCSGGLLVAESCHVVAAGRVVGAGQLHRLLVIVAAGRVVGAGRLHRLLVVVAAVRVACPQGNFVEG